MMAGALARIALAGALLLGAISLEGCASHAVGTARLPLAGPIQGAVRQTPPKPDSPQSETHPAPKMSVAAVNLESWDPRLSAALAQLALGPTGSRFVQVAIEYRRLGVLDQAHAYFTKAVEIDPTNAAAFDALARIWRDWGFASLGVNDAERAVLLAPASASAANTLGTLLESVGRIDEARHWYERALSLDPNAPYALNNLCYSAIMLGQSDSVTQCRRALAVVPGSRVARNNLGLAHAAAGNLVAAKELFDVHGEVAYAQYNMGIVYMGTRQFDKALAAFLAAVQLDPQFERAAERVKQARIFVAREDSTGDHSN